MTFSGVLTSYFGRGRTSQGIAKGVLVLNLHSILLFHVVVHINTVWGCLWEIHNERTNERNHVQAY